MTHDTHDLRSTVADPVGPGFSVDDQIHRVDLADLEIAGSPRTEGENTAHIALLVGLETAPPPIVVHRPSMHVVDGIHRVRAAEAAGAEAIEVRYFDGDLADVFALSVKLNSSHGLPLSKADRTAATLRILGSHPEWSDRAVAALVGLCAATVARLRQSSGCDTPETRVGADGRQRPLNTGQRRRVAGELMQQQPEASLRSIARQSGLSLGTTRDVRKRLAAGQDPVPDRQQSIVPAPVRSMDRNVDSAVSALPPATRPEFIQGLSILRQDPTLRYSDAGRLLLRLLELSVVAVDHGEEFASAVPVHCVPTVVTQIRRCSSLLVELANEVQAGAEQRADLPLPERRDNPVGRRSVTVGATRAGHAVRASGRVQAAQRSAL